MKKIILVVFAILMIVTSAFAYSFFDQIVYKEFFLRAANTTVLVNRVTGEVKYVLRYNGKLIELKGPSKKQFQAMYDLQVRSE